MPWELVTTIVVSALGSQWLGVILVDKFSKSSTSKLREDIARLETKVEQNEANHLRERILRFNVELLRKQKHTREDFIDVLATIDDYNTYCKSHPEYKNNRAELAINNIKRVYEECMTDYTF